MPATVARSSASASPSITLSNRRLFAFLLLLAAVLVALTATKAKAAVSSDLDVDLDDEYNSGIDALYSSSEKNKKSSNNKKAVVDELGLDNDTDDKKVGTNGDADDDDDDDEAVDEIDYTDKDDDEDGDDKKTERKSSKNQQKKKKGKKDDGVLPQLAEQADRLNDQSKQLADAAEFFKTEAAAIGDLPKKLLATSARFTALAKLPAWKSSAMMFTTQAKKMKEQSRRIQDLIAQTHDRIPEYQKESAKLAQQAENLKEIADQNMLQGLDSEDPNVVELRKEVKSLAKDYAKTLKKSQELRKNLKQLKEQGDAVNKLAANLPDDGDVSKVEKAKSAEL